MMEAALKVTGLTKRYDRFTLENVSFEIPMGTIMGMIGENGAGKSTTINAVLDLIRRDGGEVTFWNQTLTENRELKEDIGVVFDGLNFYDTLTPKKMGKVLSLAYKTWDDGLYRQYLQRFDLPERQEIKSFSKGMKMKLNIAAALSHRPKLLILDEPTAGLDPVMRDDILEVFLEFVQDEEHSILVSSHISTDLEKIADYITFIHQGKVVFSKSKDDLRYRYGVLRCGEEAFGKMDKADMLAWRREAYQYSILVEDKESARKKYPDAVMDNTTIDDILLIYVKGEAVQ